MYPKLYGPLFMNNGPTFFPNWKPYKKLWLDSIFFALNNQMVLESHWFYSFVLTQTHSFPSLPTATATALVQALNIAHVCYWKGPATGDLLSVSLI